jgi:maltooligosyltrehalose trehalohydrolase
LFQGEEWGADTPFLYFTDHQDLELARAVVEGRRREFSAFRWQGVIPNPQDVDTFARSKLDWSQPMQPKHADLLDWYRGLIRLRLDRVVLPCESRTDSPKPTTNFDAAAQWLTFVHNDVLAVFNFGDQAQHLPMPAGKWQLVLDSSRTKPPAGAAVPPETTLIYIGG